MREDEREEMGIGSEGRREKHGEGEKRRGEKRKAGGMRGEERRGEERRGAVAEVLLLRRRRGECRPREARSPWQSCRTGSGSA